MRKIAAAVILIISLFIAVPAIAGQIEDAKNAYKRGDYRTAVRLFKPLAEQGLSEFQCNLGFMYEKGRGVPQNYAETAKWYRKAAEQGWPDAQNNLGLMYEKGQGMPQDYVLAYMWADLAITRFPVSEQAAREKAKKNRDIIASKMTTSQIAEAQRLTGEWKPRKEK